MSGLIDALALHHGDRNAFYQYLQENASRKGIPLTGLFELTPRCTLDCKMCYVHLHTSQMHRKELTAEEWISLIDEACDAGMMFASLSGGECMLHPEFQAIFNHLQSRGVLVTVYTNATLLDDDAITWLSQKRPRMIQISIYGSSAAEYEAVTGSGKAFNAVDQAIDSIRKANLPFCLSITVSRQLSAYFENIYSYCKTKEPLFISINTTMFPARRETGRSLENYSLSLNEIVDIYHRKQRLDGNQSVIARNIAEECPTDQSAGTGVTCAAGKRSFAIKWDGTMLACNVFEFAKAYPLRDGFAKAWQYIHQRALSYQMPVECSTCKYYPFCSHCPAAHWVAVGEGCRNPLLCDEAKRMREEGLR